MARILLVLTDKPFGDRITGLLEQAGHTVEQCHSSIKAFHQYTLAPKGKRYQGIIIDHHLPEMENSDFLNQANCLTLIRQIFGWNVDFIKKNKHRIHSVLVYPKPWLILLSSHPQPVATTYEFFNLEAPARRVKNTNKALSWIGKKQPAAPIHIVHKGRGVDNVLLSKVAELEGRYYKCIYKSLMIGMILPALGCGYIIFQNFMKPISFTTFFYSITIIIVIFLFYFIKIKPQQPDRIASHLIVNKE